MKTDLVSPVRRSDAPFYVIAAFAGAGIGWADVAINDLLFTALLVLMACMALGLLRPRWPWRWVVVVGIFIPLAELAAYLLFTVKPTRAQIYGSFLAFLPGIAGAYGGAVMRQVIDNLRQGK
jgi:ABC-type multidrug transport system permease subunit